jgi:large subunit ribosomal protein L21
MNWAVIETGGKQYRVKEGQTILVEKLNSEKNKPIEFDRVLLIADDSKTIIGEPYVQAKVVGKVVDQVKGEKIDVQKYKAKTGYHKKLGHRQNLTSVLIEKIGKAEKTKKESK